MERWERHFNRGKDNLSRHNPENAIRNLQTAIESCPPSEHVQLAKVLFYTGVTLKKLGIPNGAVKSWIIAQKLNKSGNCAKMIKRFVNQYGMVKQSAELLDDWKAFQAIQLRRYLEHKKAGYFVTEAERDMIETLIHDHWDEINAQVQLDVLSKTEKLKLFSETRIIFPYFHVPENYTFDAAAEIRIDFNRKRKIQPNDRCLCGSRITYSQCCGRTLGVDELLYGAK